MKKKRLREEAGVRITRGKQIYVLVSLHTNKIERSEKRAEGKKKRAVSGESKLVREEGRRERGRK